MRNQDKKGAIAITGMFVVLIVSVLIALAFIFSSRIMYALLGLVLFGGAIYLISFVKSDNLKVFFALVIIVGAGILLVVGGGFLQSLLSVDTTVIDDKVHWIVTGTANNLDEGYKFIRYSPDDYEREDGTEVQPKDSLDLRVSKGDSYCDYSFEENVVTKFYFVDFSYYTLKSPERTANFIVEDENTGDSKTIDGTTEDSYTFNKDGGKAVVEPQGILSSKEDCPDYENVVMTIDDDGNKNFYYRNQFEDYLDDMSLSLTDIYETLNADLSTNTQFIEAFNDYEVSSTEFKGDIDIGSAVFTITADEDYFDSFVYEPPKQVEPKISNIMIGDIEQGESGSVRVFIDNMNDEEGKATISASADKSSVDPSSTSIQLKDSADSYFTVTPGSFSSGSDNICFEVCSTSQFEETNCDEQCESFEIIEEEPNEGYCGDDTCQEWETETTCPEDCSGDEKGNETESLECAWYQEAKFQNDVDRDWYNYIGFGEPTVISKPVCATAGWVYGLIAGVVILILGITAIFLLRGSGKSRRRSTTYRRIRR